MEIDKLINIGALRTKVQLHTNRWNGKESSWSKSFDFGNRSEETIANGLARIFGISNLNRELFHLAVDGDGQELRRISTLHSSSLLAFLFFSGVSKLNKLAINGIEYDKCFFEIQNKVFPNSPSSDRPSNVDVVLYSSHSNQLLFIESKFTEYMSHGKAFAAEKYHDIISNIIKNCDLNLCIEDGIKCDERNGFKICLKNGRNNQYIEGFKQAISHIIGILTGLPTEHNPKDYIAILDSKPTLAFASVIFDVKNLNNDETDKYSRFYNSTIGQLSNQETFKYIFDNPEFKYHEVEVLENIMTYQGLIAENPQFELPSAFMGYYRIKQ